MFLDDEKTKFQIITDIFTKERRNSEPVLQDSKFESHQTGKALMFLHILKENGGILFIFLFHFLPLVIALSSCCQSP